MLNQLFIKNYALIKELSLAPAQGLSIITGETGAGKSIMLGAVGLLLGNRADIKSLLDAESKCVIEGHFDLSEYNLEPLFKKEDLDFENPCIIRREIVPSGKSRAFVNDTPVTLDILKKIGIKLMDIHSQHEALQLGKNSFQIKFIDVFGNTLPLRQQYFKAYSAYKKTLLQLEELIAEQAESNKESDYNSFLLSELETAKLVKDELEPLEKMVKLMENAEEIKQGLQEGIALIAGDEFSVTNGLRQLRQRIGQLAKISNQYQTIEERIESALIELDDISNELEREDSLVDFDPEESLKAQERLGMIYDLQQKHKVSSIEELLELQEELSQKVLRTSNLDQQIAKVKAEAEKYHNEAIQLANELSDKRKQSFTPLAEALMNLLKEVGMPEAVVEISQKDIDLAPIGKDELSLLFSANKGVAPQTLAAVASGGEFSRLMFCIKYLLAEKIAMPTVIFDEIDSGISGEIAIKMSQLMKRMAQHHQLIAISHLPQIAAKGDKHFFVYKDNSDLKTVSRLRELSSEEKTHEIAKMIGGDNPSATAFENAKELINK